MTRHFITDARWLFGPEFDSAEYASNRQLRTVIKKIFKVEPTANTFANDQKRPDLFFCSDTTKSITGAEQFNPATNLVEMRQILIIELKRGGSSLSRNDRDQAVHYVEDFIGCKELTGNPHIVAYVVGETISEKVVGKQQVGDNGCVYVTIFAQLIDTAKRRLFNLKEKLAERYEGMDGLELFEKFKQLRIEGV